MSPRAAGPLEQYRSRVAAGDIAFDEAQAAVAEALETLHRRLERGLRTKRTFLSRTRDPEPRGLYIFGGVGRGKSMLMDMFFASAPIEQKRRVHFHAFMLEVHECLSRWRKLDDRERRREAHYVRGTGDDPIPPAAERIAQNARLLCFDEFQVEDPATAMILGRLFDQLWARGVTVVGTSNRPPDDLYKDGLNRQIFLPFIAELKTRLDVLELDGGTDYRLKRVTREPVYHVASGSEAHAMIDQAWDALTDGSKGMTVALEVQGRRFEILTAKGVARATFDTLCREARGPADYLAIAEAFPVLLLEGIPQLTSDERNEARRFLTLIDALYEARTKLICTAASEPGDIYRTGDGTFQFSRAVSRLAEMQSADYLALAHVTAR